MTFDLSAQKLGFFSSETVRTKFPEVIRAEQRIQSIAEGWQREDQAFQEQIENLEFEIKKNRLIWTESEKVENESKLQKIQKQQLDFNSKKYKPGGEYEETVRIIMEPVEAKVYAAVQEVAAEEGVDIVWDQSIQAMPYVNFKFDLTLKILKKLGVDVDAMEKELQEKIDKDPRNQQREAKTSTRTKSRTKTPKTDANNSEIENNSENPSSTPQVETPKK